MAAKEEETAGVTAPELSGLMSKLINKGGLNLRANYEPYGLQSCKIDASWDFHGVEVKHDTVSFVASKGGQMVRFLVRNEFKEAFLRWITETAREIAEGVETMVTETIVFLAGVIDPSQAKNLVPART